MKWFQPMVAAGLTLNALRYRQRLRGLPVLDESGVGPDPAGSDAADDYRVLGVVGVQVLEPTRRAAVEHARCHALEVLDLVPGDLPSDRLVDLLRAVDPRTYPGDALAAGRSAGHATLVHTALLERADIDPDRPRTTFELLDVVETLKQYAPWSTGIAIAPMLRARAPVGARWDSQAQLYGGAVAAILGTRTAALAGLAGGALRGGLPGAVALAAYQLQPLLITAGTPVRPADRHRLPATRLAERAGDVVDSVLSRRASVIDPVAEVQDRRASYPEVVVSGEQFLEERREDCPICGGTDLSQHAVVPDLIQGKPGRFVVDRCNGCRLLFQNPRLTLAGLDFYYRDFYDGLSGKSMEATFSSGRSSYEGRVDLVGSLTTPRRWLDVGTGKGHFSLIAREKWPNCEIDGLDFTPNVDLAERRGWIDHAHNGLFTDLAPKLRGAYDVVSMHHYLEHTRDPGAEIDAAAEVVAPGGYLEIEVPNPDSLLARALGRYWVGLLQPQHQQLIPLPVLAGMLVERGFTPVAMQVAEAHQPADLGCAAYFLTSRLAPEGDVPWRLEPASATRRFARVAVGSALFPLVLAGYTLDGVLASLVARSGGSSAYRIVGQKQAQKAATDA